MNPLYAIKPFLSALLLPPALWLVLLGVCLAWRGRWKSRMQALAAAVLLLMWLSACTGTGRWMLEQWLRPPAALDETALRHLQHDSATPATVILVLGAGRYSEAAEYEGQSDLTPQGMSRLRYGVWLARRLHQPLAYAGGIGWGQKSEGASEAETAARIVDQEWGLKFLAQESRSRDTRENAQRSIPLLQAAGVKRIVLVTHCWHMPRALKHFEAATAGTGIELVAAPLGFPGRDDHGVLDWVPSAQGLQLVQWVSHELLGLAVGA
jgi:uncharacterized SAM-binding protein YcdF (DUF218 family)